MSVWFEGDNEISCNIQEVQRAIENHGEHYLDIVRLMPGLTSVELVEQHDDSVTIKTNEGLMKRTNVSKLLEADRVVVEFDEEYQAGSRVTTRSHFRDEFTTSDIGVNHRLVMSRVEASGFLGFFYRKFGSAKMGKAFLVAYKTYFEKRADGTA